MTINPGIEDKFPGRKPPRKGNRLEGAIGYVSPNDVSAERRAGGRRDGSAIRHDYFDESWDETREKVASLGIKECAGET